MIRLLIDNIIGCNIRHIYNNIYWKYNQEQHKLFWYNMDCNPGIYPELSQEEGTGLCLHASELPLVLGTESDYGSAKPANCTWNNQTRTYSNQIISYWISMAEKGKSINQWPKYDPLTQEYLQFTPFHEFFVETWNNDCSIFD